MDIAPRMWIKGSMDKKVTVVVPTIREDCISTFLKQWEKELSECNIIIVEDNPAKSFGLLDIKNLAHYAWDDIDKDLGKDSWIIPRKTDCVRSYGFLRA